MCRVSVQGPSEMVMRTIGAVTAAQLALLPLSGAPGSGFFRSGLLLKCRSQARSLLSLNVLLTSVLLAHDQHRQQLLRSDSSFHRIAAGAALAEGKGKLAVQGATEAGKAAQNAVPEGAKNPKTREERNTQCVPCTLCSTMSSRIICHRCSPALAWSADTRQTLASQTLSMFGMYSAMNPDASLRRKLQVATCNGLEQHTQLTPSCSLLSQIIRSGVNLY